jgi:hypothetical protein
VFDATRHDQEFAYFQPDVAIPELHAKPTLHHEKKLVLMVVVVPHKWPLKLDEFYPLAVQFTYDLRLPVVGEMGEFFGKVDFLYLRPPHVLATLLDDQAVILQLKTGFTAQRRGPRQRELAVWRPCFGDLYYPSLACRERVKCQRKQDEAQPNMSQQLSGIIGNNREPFASLFRLHNAWQHRSGVNRQVVQQSQAMRR